MGREDLEEKRQKRQDADRKRKRDSHKERKIRWPVKEDDEDESAPQGQREHGSESQKDGWRENRQC